MVGSKKGDPKRGIRPSNHLKTTFKSLLSYHLSGSPFSDPPLGDGECLQRSGPASRPTKHHGQGKWPRASSISWPTHKPRYHFKEACYYPFIQPTFQTQNVRYPDLKVNVNILNFGLTSRKSTLQSLKQRKDHLRAVDFSLRKASSLECSAKDLLALRILSMKLGNPADFAAQIFQGLIISGNFSP